MSVFELFFISDGIKAFKTTQFPLTVVNLLLFVYEHKLRRYVFQDSLLVLGPLHRPTSFTFVLHGGLKLYQAHFSGVIRRSISIFV